MQTLRSDNAKEYLLERFQSYMLQHQIFHQTSCVDTSSQNGVAKRKNTYLLETARAILFQMNAPKHFWADTASIACFFINRMPSSVLNWTAPYHQLFPNKLLFPIDPKVFECTCFVRDILVFKKGIGVICPTLRRYFVPTNVAFFETTPFSLPSTVTSQGEEEDLLVYTLASPIVSSKSAPVPARVKPPITQVYTRCQHPQVSSPPPPASTSDPVLSNDLSIAP